MLPGRVSVALPRGFGNSRDRMGSAITRVAIVNRGDAAIRCLRAIRELRAQAGSDLVGIALYTDPDRFSTFEDTRGWVDQLIPLTAYRDREVKLVFSDWELPGAQPANDCLVHAADRLPPWTRQRP